MVGIKKTNKTNASEHRGKRTQAKLRVKSTRPATVGRGHANGPNT